MRNSEEAIKNYPDRKCNECKYSRHYTPEATQCWSMFKSYEKTKTKDTLLIVDPREEIKCLHWCATDEVSKRNIELAKQKYNKK